MPSKPAGNSNQTTTSQTQTQLPQWVDNAAQNALTTSNNLASNINATNPVTQLQTAPITAGGQSAIQTLYGLMGYGAPQYGAAQQGAQGAINYQPQQVGSTTSGFLSGLQGYMNPYTQSVINPALAQLGLQQQQALNQNADLANKTGAFAGSASRANLQDAQTNALYGMQGASLTGQLNAANFQQASQAEQAAQLANQQAGLQGAGLNLSGANSLASITGQASQTQEQQAAAALQGQQLIQQNQQAQNQAAQDYAAAQRQAQIDPLQIQLATLRGLPYGQTQTSVGTGAGPTSNPFLTGLGGLAAGTGIAGNIAGLLGAIPTGGASLAIPGVASIGSAFLQGAR